jgi:predicted metal-dependent phosphoesterase TrpH
VAFRGRRQVTWEHLGWQDLCAGRRRTTGPGRQGRDGALVISTIDLHVHTFYSDGRDAPEAVLRRAAALGIKTVAIADHDNTNGVRQVQTRATELGLCLIPAIELTCRWERCRSAPGEGDIDVLGYWMDLGDAGFRAFEQATLEDIHQRVSDCCVRLTADGYPLSIESLFERNPHYAGLQYLIHEIQDRGYAPDWGDAFSLMMRGWRQVRLSRFTIEETIEQIHRAGGVAALAHPTAIECDGHWLQESDLATLVEMGLDGLEIYHPRLDRHARIYFSTLAQRFDLLVSGGSDAHGWFDEWQGLGTQPVTHEMVAAIQARHVEWKGKL